MTHDPRSPADVQHEQQRETAAWCGYSGPDAVAKLNLEHDPLHHVLAGFFGKASPTLRWVASGYRELAHPTRHDDVVGWEEATVLAMQLFINTGEFTSELRILWWLGVDPDKLRSALCRHLGRESAATPSSSEGRDVSA